MTAKLCNVAIRAMRPDLEQQEPLWIVRLSMESAFCQRVDALVPGDACDFGRRGIRFGRRNVKSVPAPEGRDAYNWRLGHKDEFYPGMAKSHSFAVTVPRS